MTIYESIGGNPGVAALLEGLYVRALADPLLKPMLDDIDINRLKAHQFAFISQAIGGPHQYAGSSLTAAHARLKIEPRHFDAFVDHLKSTLEEMGASGDVITEILARVTPLSAVIVNAPSGQSAAG